MTLTTKTSSPGWSPDVTSFPPEDVVADALLMLTATKHGEVEGDAPSVRVTFVDDDDADFVAEGAEIPEADDELNEVTVFTGKVSKLVRISREQYAQQEAAGRLANGVRRAIIRRANEAYLTQAAPTSPAVTPPPGLLNITGTVAGEAVGGDLDALVDLLATLEGNGGNPTHLVLDPTGWAELRKLKTGTASNESLLGAGTTDATRMLLDLPVIVTPSMPAARGLVLDSAAVAAVFGSVQIASSPHVFFSSDSIAVRATWRIGWNLVRPDRVGTFTITASE